MADTLPPQQPMQAVESPDEAIKKVATERGINPAYLIGLARLETAGGSKTIKGEGVDTRNLFNIKDFSGKGIAAFDKAEKSNDRYREYGSYEDSARDLLGLLERKYPNALTAKDGAEFATALKAGGYATDPAYVAKLTKVIGSPGVMGGKPAAPAGPTAQVETSDTFELKAQGAARALTSRNNQELADVEPGRRAVIDEQTATAKRVKESRDTGILDVAGAALQHPAYQPTLAVLRAIENSDEDLNRPADWNNDAAMLKLEQQHFNNPQAIDFIRENVRGPDSLRRVEAELVVRGELDAVIGRAAPATAIIGTLLGGAADPGSMLAGVGLMKAAQIAKVGSGAFIAQGRVGAALASAAAENVAGNLVVDAAADLSGEVYSGADYAVSAAMALGFSGLAARGITRAAAEANLGKLADKIRDDHLTAHANLVGRAKQELGDGATVGQVQAKVDEIQVRDNEERARAIKAVVPDDDKVVPPEITRQIRDELEGNDVAPPVRDDLNVDAVEPPPPPTNNIEVGDNLAGLDGGGDQTKPVVRLIDTDDGEAATVAWTIRKDATAGDATVGDILDIIADPTTGARLSPGDRAIAERLRVVTSKWQGQIGVSFNMTKGRSYYAPPGSVVGNADPEVVMRLGTEGKADLAGTSPTARKRMPLTDLVGKLKDDGLRVLLHEVTHAVTHAQIEAVKRGTLRDDRALQAVANLESLRTQLKRHIVGKPGITKNWGAEYATKNLHEFVAQVASDTQTRAMLADIEVGGGRSALSQFVKTVTKMLGFDKPTRTALDEALLHFDRLVKLGKDVGGETLYSAADVVHMAPDIPGVLPGAAVDPDRTASARTRWVPAMYERAKAILARNPIDKERLDVLTKYVEGGFSDGLKLAGSANDILKSFAVMVVETTTGAGGRRATVAVDRELKFAEYIGNAVQRGEQSYSGWVRSVKGEGFMSQVVNDVWKGDLRREFNDLVSDEIRGRAYGRAPSTNRFVLEAANELAEGFERMRVSQIEHGTLGSKNLEGLDGRKYLPQNLEGSKLAVMPQERVNALSDILATQLKDIMPEWDEAFRKRFSDHYLKRAKDRAMAGAGDRNAMQATDGLADIRTALDDLGGPPDDIKKAKQALNTRSGLSQTKHRINWDMDADLPWGGRLRDLFTNDPFQLYRSYANRTAGNVALTRAGILGEKGLIEMREAIQAAPNGQQATALELDAFDRVAAELLGRPVPGAVVSDVPNALRAIVSLQRLGGMAITQLAETTNAVHHLGLTATLKAVVDLPRHIGNVGRVAKGGKANDLLGSIEFIGGKEVGMDSYKLVAPLDPPDDRLMVYGDQQGWFMKLLGAGGHLQAKIGFFRGIMAAQQRAMAEQTLIKALKYIDAGETGNIALRDAGFSDSLVQRIKPFMDEIRTKDADGNLLSVDLTKLPDTRAAEEFVQGIWRMNSQIIQGSFIGERSKWFHNDYMKMFLQLRTFGLTAQEKQFGRNRLNHGYAKAAGIIAAQVAIGSMIHLARVQANSALREDREKYLKDQASVGALVKAGMNYSSATGLFGEAYQYAVALGGNYIDDKEIKRQLGVQGQSTSVGGLIPAAGSVDSAIKVVSGRSNAFQASKQLPFSNLWYVAPFLGALKQE